MTAEWDPFQWFRSILNDQFFEHDILDVAFRSNPNHVLIKNHNYQ